MLEGCHFVIYTDHKPLIYTFRQGADGHDNVVADIFPSTNAVTTPVDLLALAASQRTLASIRYSTFMPKNLQSLTLIESPGSQCQNQVDRPTFRVVTYAQRLSCMDSRLHALSMLKNHSTYTHTVWRFLFSTARFAHIYVDIIGPLPVSDSYRYCLTATDKCTCWLEVFPMTSITAETIVKAMLVGWTICPDLVSRSESLWIAVASLRFTFSASLGGFRAFSSYTQASAYMPRWRILDGCSTTCITWSSHGVENDVLASSAKMVYGEPLRLRTHINSLFGYAESWLNYVHNLDLVMVFRLRSMLRTPVPYATSWKECAELTKRSQYTEAMRTSSA
ncbi:uncharacterized protein LOC143431629 [Xylocopa sonorina]|uniref:uncharacterized protein LOC143431629 n=1 Tax=Xylocopa sonorina TaxID=1818115 RepID=UPI00403AEDF4